MRLPTVAAVLLVPLALGACAVVPPTGPSVMALPGKDRSFAQFQQQDATCRNYAAGQIGAISPAQAATQSGVGSATLGTVLGAAAGAVLGAASGNPGAGAAIGAGTGLLFGGASGAGAAQASAGALQQRYDAAYSQCMVADGNTITTPPGGYYGYGAYPYYGYGAYPYAPYGYPAYPGYYPGYGYAYPAYPYAPVVGSVGVGFAFGGGFHHRHRWRGGGWHRR